MEVGSALAQLKAAAEPGRGAEMAAYHKARRVYLGVRNPEINALAQIWRQALDVPGRVALADGLWRCDIHEARVAAAKLLTQARLRPDEAVWDLISCWVPEFDGWAIADHACSAGSRRLVSNPTRLDAVERWVSAPHMWTRRAALVITLPWTKHNHPDAQDLAVRDRVLGWAGALVTDRDWFIQKAIAWWVRELSKHDAARARGFLDRHGTALAGFARKEAGKHLKALE